MYKLNALDLSADQQLLAGATNNSINVFSFDAVDCKYKDPISYSVHSQPDASGRIVNVKPVVDLRFNPSLSFAHLLATTSTSGSIAVWNLNVAQMQPHNFLESILRGHTQTVNSLSWHPSNPQTLLSGSQDKHVRLWDLRVKHCSTLVINPRNGVVRDVQHRAIDGERFAAAFDNGTVQVWDVRHPKACETKFTAHDMALTVDWHPDSRDLLASGGRDGYIKIWNCNKNSGEDNVNEKRRSMFSQYWIRNSQHRESQNHGKKVTENHSTPMHTIQTIDSSVNRVRWRPNHFNQIASTTLRGGCISVWDVTKPYVPLACMGSYKDPIAGWAWVDQHLAQTDVTKSTLHGPWWYSPETIAEANQDLDEESDDTPDNDIKDEDFDTMSEFSKYTSTSNMATGSSHSHRNINIRNENHRNMRKRQRYQNKFYGKQEDVETSWGVVVCCTKASSINSHFVNDALKPLEKVRATCISLSVRGDMALVHDNIRKDYSRNALMNIGRTVNFKEQEGMKSAAEKLNEMATASGRNLKVDDTDNHSQVSSNKHDEQKAKDEDDNDDKTQPDDLTVNDPEMNLDPNPKGIVNIFKPRLLDLKKAVDMKYYDKRDLKMERNGAVKLKESPYQTPGDFIFDADRFRILAKGYHTPKTLQVERDDEIDKYKVLEVEEGRDFDRNVGKRNNVDIYKCCDHNSAVAEQALSPSLVKLWQIIKLFFTQNEGYYYNGRDESHARSKTDDKLPGDKIGNPEYPPGQRRRPTGERIGTNNNKDNDIGINLLDVDGTKRGRHQHQHQQRRQKLHSLSVNKSPAADARNTSNSLQVSPGKLNRIDKTKSKNGLDPYRAERHQHVGKVDKEKMELKIDTGLPANEKEQIPTIDDSWNMDNDQIQLVASFGIDHTEGLWSKESLGLLTRLHQINPLKSSNFKTNSVLMAPDNRELAEAILRVQNIQQENIRDKTDRSYRTRIRRPFQAVNNPLNPRNRRYRDMALSTLSNQGDFENVTNLHPQASQTLGDIGRDEPHSSAGMYNLRRISSDGYMSTRNLTRKNQFVPSFKTPNMNMNINGRENMMKDIEIKKSDGIRSSPYMLVDESEHSMNDLDIFFPGMGNKLIQQILDHHADIGDVQTCSMIVLVLGDRIQPKIEPERIEQWLCSYIDLLQRLQLYSIAARIISTCGYDFVQGLYKMTSEIKVMCTNESCRKKFLQEKSNFKGLCPRCSKSISMCSICQNPVRGVYVWCQACGHGGHISHMRDWFSMEEYCPTGCGHRCDLKLLNSDH